MTTKNPLDSSLKLMEMAANIGAQAAKDMETQAKAQDTRLDKLSKARELVEADKRDNSGFGTIRFKAFASVGAAFGAAFNDPTSKPAREALEGAALSFLSSMTAKSADTLKGGGVIGAAKSIIGLGTDAERLRAMMQNRLEHWQAMKDVADAEGGEDAVAKRELAMRYLAPCGPTPDANGQPKVNDKGKVIVPKHNGRPVTTITVGSTKVRVPAGGQTNRESMFAFAAAFMAKHGDVVLNEQVIDALLDNGGRYKADPDNVMTHASTALDSIEKLLMLGGNRSGDAAHLTLFTSVLERIRKEGFKSATIADDSPTTTESEPTTDSPVATESTAPDPVDDLVTQALDGADKVLATSPVVKPSNTLPPAKPINRPARKGGGL